MMQVENKLNKEIKSVTPMTAANAGYVRRESKLKIYKDDDDLDDDLMSENGSIQNVLSITSDSVDLNEIDPFMNLPESWAHLDFQRKKSCILSNIYSTCVTKAINHLELLQITIDKWAANIENTIPGSFRSVESSKRLINYVRRNTIRKNKKELRFVNNDDDDSDVITSNALEIKGKGTELIIQQNKQPVEDLKVGGILEEILILIGRLEFDRRRTELLLLRERDICEKLKQKLEKMSLRRAIELPLRVQREHEACITDITELNWHISFNTKAERKLIHKIENEDVLHSQLKDDLIRLKKNMPLLDEKIESELYIFKEISRAQYDVEDLLSHALENLANTQERFDESMTKANKEREAIKADLDDARRHLKKAIKRLKTAEDSCKEYIQIIDQCVKKITENEVQEKLEVRKRLELRDQNDQFKDRTKFLDEERLRISKETERVIEENKKIEKIIDEKTQKYNAELEKLIEVMNKKLDKMEKIMKKNQEKEINIEEMSRDKLSFEQKLKKDERTKERSLEQTKSVESEHQIVRENHLQAIMTHESANADFVKQMEKFDRREATLKKQIVDLKKQKAEERNIYNALLSRMRGEEEEFNKAKAAANEKKAQLEKKKEEVDGRLKEIESRVEKIEATKILLDDEISILSAKLAETLHNHNILEADLTKKMSIAEPLHKKIIDEYTANKSQLEYMKSHTIQMKAKLIEMAENKTIMLKLIDQTNIENEALEKIYHEASIQLEENKKLDTDNRKTFDQTNVRMERYEQNHQQYMEERMAYLDRIRNQLDEFLKLNKELASRYRYLKYDMYNTKFNTLRKLEYKMNTMLNVNDKRQLKILQERMHYALRDYFYYKIKNSENHLYDLNDKRNEVGDKLKSLEHFLYSSIDYMSEFLDNQNDFSHQIRQNAMQKVYQEELLEQQQQQQKKHNEHYCDSGSGIRRAVSVGKVLKVKNPGKSVEFLDAI